MSLANKRVLVVAHGHPDLNKGGAEMAAYNMFNEFRRQDVDAFFLARTDQKPHGGAAFSSRNSDREILFHTTMDDWFLFSNIKTRHMWQEFRDLLMLIKPDVVHLHHYFLLGIEMMQEIRTSLPKCKIVLTLHEYLGICHQKGLMVKPSGKLCYKASPRDCHGCFPDKQPGDFFLREQYIKRIFSVVDQFVSPSAFLKQRYVDWGLDFNRIEVIENGQLPTDKLKRDDSPLSKVRLAFFGQINPYKGIDVLLHAVKSLPKKVQYQLSVEIHGANFELQSGQYQKSTHKLLDQLTHVVKMCGAYEAREMPKLLSRVDWVVVPSKWWENSPMVIQEAFTQKVPLIVSDIGGMAEKVLDGINGIHFGAGNAMDLARVIESVVANRALQNEYSANIRPPMSIEECINQHADLYL
ncbi:glycosyltransferase family 4 protein [Neiella marina]|uniref:Glycosyltransferase family 4 protein n=1 Tax=Neiella holothuriorum TaxID=2870530 RepID=A0ABS7EGC3_9GAMM|nr:glycosyltransferase family 4 protein [Neiella holothuriorum]MBW8190747.1 glycosyltransferase family 4 protein [Neiella holothuriorum]